MRPVGAAGNTTGYVGVTKTCRNKYCRYEIQRRPLDANRTRRFGQVIVYMSSCKRWRFRPSVVARSYRHRRCPSKQQTTSVPITRQASGATSHSIPADCRKFGALLEVDRAVAPRVVPAALRRRASLARRTVVGSDVSCGGRNQKCAKSRLRRKSYAELMLQLPQLVARSAAGRSRCTRRLKKNSPRFAVR